MNKNIITLGVFMSASVMADVSYLTAPSLELYSDNLVQKSRAISSRPYLTQITQAKIGKNYSDISAALVSSHNIKIRSAVYNQLDEVEILTAVAQRIMRSNPLPEEFSKIIDDNFWDLI